MRAAFFAFVGCRRVSAHRGAARLRDACVGEWGEESRFYRGAHRGIPAPSECDPDGAARFCRFARRRTLRGRRFSGRRTLPDARRRKRRGEQWTKGPRIQGAASMSAAVNRESHAFRPAGAAPLRRRSGTAHGLMHQPSTCVACRETMAGAEYCTRRLRSVASRSPRRRGRIRNVLCDGRRRGRSAAFAVRRSPLARRSIMRAAAADPDAHTRPTDLHVRSDRRIVLREIRALSRVLGRARARAASARARRTARRWIGARATGGSSRFRSARRARRPLPGSSALRRRSAASPRAVFQAAIRRRE
ncbi:Uncharacterised protein [Burkholderia pseudomallei]|nr:hypothetical protein DR56_4773 [Burkholderia pseudomallei MSHR5858]AJX84364.1 hypothetical protein BG97_5696 [Burkholderia pseudomallei 7894]CAJ2943481.1 Uncharacterised protein [Burkholderia pseudomallei]CAJ3168853.1 Uncharacterised protein [Burkholderia pseudomallei]CAJ5813636.1 Uncharacterised protein [Burkholderia pseudomallei]